MIRLETVRVSVRELRGNLTRSLLTMLGIVFGVAAVIAMVSIAEGARLEAVSQVAAMGTSTVRVRARELSGQDLARARQAGVAGLTLEDVAAIARLPGVASVAPVAVIEDVPVRRGEHAPDARVVGTTPAYADITGASVARGRFLTDDDVRGQASVVVLGAGIAQDLVPHRDPIGEELRVGDATVRVVGVLEDRRQSSSRIAGLEAADAGRDVILPVSAALGRLPRDVLGTGIAEIVVQAEAGASVREVGSIVSEALSRRHAGAADFEVVVPEELLRQSQRSQRIFNVVMGAIASISLVVGGIGIMNVMLVTVMQRTREIGIRRAVGASRKDVRDQFLVEALTIASVGGFVGVVLGVGLAAVIAGYAGWLTVVSPVAVAVALVVAGATGVGFGLFPAIKASRMDPMDCLRAD